MYLRGLQKLNMYEQHLTTVPRRAARAPQSDIARRKDKHMCHADSLQARADRLTRARTPHTTRIQRTVHTNTARHDVQTCAARIRAPSCAQTGPRGTGCKCAARRRSSHPSTGRAGPNQFPSRHAHAAGCELRAARERHVRSSCGASRRRLRRNVSCSVSRRRGGRRRPRRSLPHRWARRGEW
jgi:hypothetical protein